MIEFKNVQKFYTNNGVANIGLQNINVKFVKNEIVAITGESGSGKSTLLNVISKIDNFDEGEIYYKGNETSYFTLSDMDDFRKNKVGFIFQNYNILDSYTVLDNVMIPLLLKGKNKIEAKSEALVLIEKVGLKGREHHRGSKLSGGEKQRCVIARALAGDCEILACDEPTGNLDSKTASEIISLIKEVAKDKLVLIVTHNYQEVKDMVTRQIKMADGKIIEDIVYTYIPDDENQELDLDYKPLPRKVLFNIATSNLLFTPRKTLITSIIFLIISFAFLFIAQAIAGGFNSTLNSSAFNNRLDNYVFVYDSHCESIDLTLLEQYDYDYNNFAAEYSTSCLLDDKQMAIVYHSFLPKGSLVAGAMPSGDNEFILLFADDDTSTINTFAAMIGKELVIESFKTLSEERFILSGIYAMKNQDQLNSNSVYFVSGSDKLKSYLNKACPIISGYVTNGKEVMDIELTYDSGTFAPTLLLPLSYEHQTYETYLFLEETYVINQYDVEYQDVDSPILRLCVDGDLILDPFFAYVKVDSFNVNSVMKNIHKMGLDVVYPYESTNDNLITKIVIKIVIFVVNLELSCYLIGIFFITYVILSKIYISRVKDYQILRTLGVTKRDMSKVVNYEIVLLGMIISIINCFIVNALIYSSGNLKFMQHIHFETYLLYFVVMFLFTYLMGKRFNKRLFKFTVRKSMKGVEEDDQD